MVRKADVVLDDGTVAVVKTADGQEGAALRAEGERLAAAQHPGVVELVRSGGDEHRWELCLAHGGRPASLLRAGPPEQVAAIVHAAASTLADLHERGIVHGRLQARHLLVGPEGTVRLCGFGADAGGAVPQDDVAALGAVVVELLGPHEALEPLPEPRWRRRGGWPGVARRSLLAVADLACAEPPSRRPTARRMAAIVADAVPSVAGRGAPAARRVHPRPVGAAGGAVARHTSAPRHRRPRRPGPPWRWAPLLAAWAGAALLVAAWARQPAGGPAPPTTSSPGAAHGAACAVVDPDASCQPIAIDGTTVQVGEARFEVGRPGDQVIALDWDCDGSPTPAVLRPSTGEVFLFPAWALDEPLEVAAVAVVPQARAIHPPPGRCGPPVVERSDGDSVPIPGAPTT